MLVARARGFRRARAGGLRRRMEMGRHPRAGGGGRAQRRRHGRAALFAHRRGYFGQLPRSRRGVAAARPRSTANSWSCATAACRASTCCSSGSTARPSTPSCSPNFPRTCAPTICWSRATRTCASCRLPSAARGSKRSSRGSTTRASTSRRSFLSPPGTNSPRRGRIPPPAGAGDDAGAVEGIMLKRRDALYVPGRPKGLWWKWKRDPFVVDAVLMYAQRGHGKRSSYLFRLYVRGLDERRGRRTSSCRSARPISASPTRS